MSLPFLFLSSSPSSPSFAFTKSWGIFYIPLFPFFSTPGLISNHVLLLFPLKHLLNPPSPLHFVIFLIQAFIISAGLHSIVFLMVAMDTSLNFLHFILCSLPRGCFLREGSRGWVGGDRAGKKGESKERKAQHLEIKRDIEGRTEMPDI